MEESGAIIFGNLPILFAVGVALGLAGGEGVAALAAIVGYLIMNATMGTGLGLSAKTVLEGGDPAYALLLGVPSLQSGVFGGIIVGVLAAAMYNRYYDIELPVIPWFFCRETICTDCYSSFCRCPRITNDLNLATSTRSIKCVFKLCS